MNKKKKGIILGIVLISAIITVGLINNKHDVYQRPDYDPIATINHSEMLGADAGTEFIYYIYKSKKNSNKYFYIKTESSITIAGYRESIDIDSGPLKNKNDLKKIAKDIEKDSQNNAQSYVSYYYINNGNDETCENIDALGKKLFN